MNWDQIKSDWKQLSVKLKERWGELTDDELTAVAGRRLQLAGLLEKHYGYPKERAELELDKFTRNLTR